MQQFAISSFSYHRTVVRGLARGLAACSSLTHLYLFCEDLSDEARCDLTKIMSVSSTLQTVIVQGIINNDTVFALAEGISSSNSLREFELLPYEDRLCFLDEIEKMDNTAGLALAGALAASSTLTRFTLSKDYLSDEIGCALAEAMAHNSTLQAFCLTSRLGVIGDATMCALAKGISSSGSLREFSLICGDDDGGRPDVGSDASAIAFADALRSTRSLRSLTLRAPAVFHPAFLAALQANVTLLQVRFDGCASAYECEPIMLRNREFNTIRHLFQHLLSKVAFFGCLRDGDQVVAFLASPEVAALRPWARHSTGALVQPSQPQQALPQPPQQPAGFSAGNLRLQPSRQEPGISDRSRVRCQRGPAAGPSAAPAAQPPQQLAGGRAGKVAETNAEIAEALHRSRVEGPPGCLINRDGVVLAKLNGKAHCPAVLDALLSCTELEDCRRRVRDADCEVQPLGPEGPKFFVPDDVDGVSEDLRAADLTLERWHVLIRKTDVPLLEAALRRLVPLKRRPKVLREQGFEEGLEYVTIEHVFPNTNSDLFPTYPEHYVGAGPSQTPP